MATTDLHGWVLPWDYYSDHPEPRFGIAKIATLVDSLRRVHPYTLLLDAGDWLQGNPMADYFATVDTLRRYPLLRAMDHMGYDAVVLGNHEFNFGIELLNRRIAQTATPILAGNVYAHGTTEPAYVPYIMRDVGGVRVAIVGLTTPGSAVWDRPRVAGRLDFADGVAAARRWVDEARQEGAELVVILAHTGLDGTSSYGDDRVPAENFGRAVAEQVPGVDLLVLGHAHRVIADVVPGAGGWAVPVIMSGQWGHRLGVAELAILRDRESGEVAVASRRLASLPIRYADPHPEIEALAAEAHEAVRARMNQVLAVTDAPWSTAESRRQPTAAVDLIHQVQLAATGAQLSAAAAFNTRVVLGPEITLGQVSQLYPYENDLYVVEISGADLRAYLEHSASYFLPPDEEGAAMRVNPGWPGYNFDMIAGAEYSLDLSRPIGERLAELKVGGRVVRDEDVFTMAVNSYRAEGGGGFPGMNAERVIRRIDTSVRDLIKEFLRSRASVSTDDVLISTWRMAPLPDGATGQR